ncbi:MAG: archaeal proteasome endopeptidase complex subunit beta [Candidatus Bathyarchaeota archaeon]|nr:archaeal proteasome endopeptidase complex subunit beta [Candidatus Bathyarchaeota archaeon]
MYKTLDELTFTGTTTVGAVGNDGVALASDTRVTMGSLVVHKKGKKVYKIDEHLALTISGVVADAQRTVEILRANSRIYRLERRAAMPVSVAAHLIANLLFSYRLFPFDAHIIIGGVDSTGPHLFSLDPFGSITEEKYVATGSGSPIAYGVLEERYRDGLPLREVLPIVTQSVNSAMKRDVATGDSFDVSVISKAGYRELNADEKGQIPVET